MGIKLDNLGRLIHDGSGIVVGIRANGIDTMMPVVLAQSAVPVALTGTTAETTLASIVIPGGLMGPNGALRISALWSTTNSAGSKDMKTKLANSNLLWLGTTTTAAAQEIVTLRNRGAVNSQITFTSAQAPFGTNGGANQAYAINTAADQVLSFAGQLASAGDVITLEGYTVELIPSL